MNIVGVRYIGKKPRQEDTVTRSGAVWEPGQVHNFPASDAEKLLVHKDSFEKAKIDPDGSIHFSRLLSSSHEPPPVINLTAMGSAEMALYARREFDRVVNIEGKDDAQVRAEVLSLMRLSALDDAVPKSELVVYPLAVTLDELSGLKSGMLKTKIVPNLKIVKPTLDELLDGLDKDGLLELAEQEGVLIDKRMNEKNLRDALRLKLQAA